MVQVRTIAQQKYSIGNVRIQLQWLYVLCEQLFLLLYLTGRIVCDYIINYLLMIANIVVEHLVIAGIVTMF